MTIDHDSVATAPEVHGHRGLRMRVTGIAPNTRYLTPDGRNGAGRSIRE